MLKKIKRLVVGLVLLCLCLPARVEGKEIKVKRGDFRTISMKNVLEVSSKNKRIARACISRSGKVRIDAAEEGRTKLKIKTKRGWRTVGVTVKKQKDTVPDAKTFGFSENEVRIASRFEGCQVAGTLTEYPYLENWDAVPDFQQRMLKKEYLNMPGYFKSCLAYWQVPLCFVGEESFSDKKINGEAATASKKCRIRIKIAKDESSLCCGVLIHEVAHAWVSFCCMNGYSVLQRRDIQEAFASNPGLYGEYGKTSISEFYAEAISVPLSLRIEIYTKDELATLLSRYGNVTSERNRREKKNHVVLRVEISERDLGKVVLSYDGRYYINGSSSNVFSQERRLAVEKYYREKYRKKGKIVDYCIVGYCDSDFIM